MYAPVALAKCVVNYLKNLFKFLFALIRAFKKFINML